MVELYTSEGLFSLDYVYVVKLVVPPVTVNTQPVPLNLNGSLFKRNRHKLYLHLICCKLQEYSSQKLQF